MELKQAFVVLVLCLVLTNFASASCNLQDCLRACEKGEMEDFCRKLRAPKRIKALCWGVVLASVNVCKGFCYARC